MSRACGSADSPFRVEVALQVPGKACGQHQPGRKEQQLLNESRYCRYEKSVEIACRIGTQPYDTRLLGIIHENCRAVLLYLQLLPWMSMRVVTEI